MTEPKDIHEVEVGDVVRHRVGMQHERTVRIEYFSSKDDRPTFGGSVLESTEPDDINPPENGWSYLAEIQEVER